MNQLNQLLTPEKKRLIMSIMAVLAIVVMIAVLVFQILEHQYYRQAPSIWPSAIHAK